MLLRKGVIDRGGQIVDGGDPRVVFENEFGRYILADKRESLRGTEVYVSQDDVNNVITAKAAVFAASKIMLDRLGLAFADVDKLFLAGGFGSHIDLENAIAIGLLPDVPLSRIKYVGNTSVWGARIAGLSAEAYEALRDIVRKTTYYDLMGSDDYVEQFRQAMFLPHTNIELFPSQVGRSAT